jgi:hypothetical protein
MSFSLSKNRCSDQRIESLGVESLALLTRQIQKPRRASEPHIYITKHHIIIESNRISRSRIYQSQIQKKTGQESPRSHKVLTFASQFSHSNRMPLDTIVSHHHALNRLADSWHCHGASTSIPFACKQRIMHSFR